jgi:nucleotide sugar dehydrogenase
MKMTVFGTGYLGTTQAVCMAELGHHVLGVDVDVAKIASLREGVVPFYEPELEPLLRKQLESGRLTFTTSFEEAAAFAELHFVCVGTPQRHGSLAADMTYVDSVIDALAPLLTAHALVVGKSTVPVGTAARLSARLAELAPHGVTTELAWSPEFLREGFAVADTLHPDRIVVGTTTAQAEVTLREVYADILNAGTPMIVTSPPTAELVKAAANSFLATKISFINAMSEVCEVTGADVTQLADAIGHDQRIGRKFLNAGLGFGGGCLPKDIRAFMARAGELGVDQAVAFLHEVDAINMRRRTYVVDVTRELLGGDLIGRRVAVLGAAFKPNSDDVRDSPALNVAGQLQLQGSQVTVFDPKANANARALFPTLGYADDLAGAVSGADVVLLLTEWTEFAALDPQWLAARVSATNIVDARNVLDPAQWRAAGWTIRSMGRK